MTAWMRATAVALLVALLGLGGAAPVAFADGDPGSDVLVNQDLFVAGDAGMSIAQQARLGALLQTADRSGFPIRVAIISHPADLGAYGALWGKPQSYAAVLGYELSLAYKQRLLVVMPDGFGVNWPGHSTAAAQHSVASVAIRPGGTGLYTAAESAVRTLAAASGVRLGSGAGGGSAASAASAAPAAAPATPPTESTASTTPTNPGQSTDSAVAAITIGLVVALGAILAARRLRARRRRPPSHPDEGRRAGRRLALPSLPVLVLGAVLLILVGGLSPLIISSTSGTSGTAQRAALETNPYLDPGTGLSTPAPDFTLYNQFGRSVSLRSFRGKVVMLAFTDSECTTICPMTTTAMLDAKAMLGSAASRVALLGVDANPASTSVEDVASYSELHGMMHAWNFLTGSLPQLKRVWKDYSVEAEIEHGLISHTPALLIISPQGREAKVYITQQSYAAVGQFGQILAREDSSLLPGHPAVHSNLSYAPVKSITPADTVSLPRSGGGTVTLGPGRTARLYVFFATWDREITGLSGDLDALNRYAGEAGKSGLPPLTAVDEAQVEPSSSALPDFLGSLAHPLAYPVAIDRSGQVADGYEVLGQPWFVLTSASGRILWYQEVSTSGWPTDAALVADVRAALARQPSAPTTPRQVAHALSGSPAPLAALHEQADRLLGSETALAARIRSLRGYPIVVNAWASWCTPCQKEFRLFASASAQFGRSVAFIGADTNDSAGDAAAFLAQHPVSYPSYQTNSSDLESLAPIEGLPTTIFINRHGQVVDVHDGQYFAQGALDGDISTYAVGGSG